MRMVTGQAKITIELTMKMTTGYAGAEPRPVITILPWQWQSWWQTWWQWGGWWWWGGRWGEGWLGRAGRVDPRPVITILPFSRLCSRYHSIPLHCIILYCIALYRITLHYKLLYIDCITYFCCLSPVCAFTNMSYHAIGGLSCKRWSGSLYLYLCFGCICIT